MKCLLNTKLNWKNTLNSVFRYLTTPFVVIGWALAKYGMWTPFGIAAVGMAIFGVLGFGLIGLLMVSGITNFQVIPGIIQVPLAFIVAVLMIIGIVRGALFSLDNKKFQETIDLHFIEPLKFKIILEGFIALIVLGLILYLFLKLLTGR